MSFATFFSNLQEAPWYRAFLNPVIDEVGAKKRLLDIGTGSGKLIQILAKEKEMDCVGVDTDSNMLAEARKKLEGMNVELIKIAPNEKLPFENSLFDYVSICSVLFHMKNEDIDRMLKNSRELLRKGGKIIVLTPTGGGNMLKLTKHYGSIRNRGAYIWYRATKKRARRWAQENYLSSYANRENLNYRKKVVMNEFAQVEILTE